MGRHKRHRASKFPLSPRSRPKKKFAKQNLYLLDEFSEADLKTWERRREDVLKYHWEYFSELAHQRSRIKDELNATLIKASAGGIKYQNWRRVVRVRYMLDPLSTKGSVRSPSGGRFNYGAIEESKFPPFPALYLASDTKTAISESLGQGKTQPGQGAFDYALTTDKAYSNFTANISLDNIIDLHFPEQLKEFVNLIKSFKLSEAVHKQAKDLNFAPPNIIQTTKELVRALGLPDWRKESAQFDVPASCQIFGQMVESAGIEGILYSSKFTGDDCIAIFPQNFRNSTSCVELTDRLPAELIKRRIDQHNWSDFI